MTNWLNAAAVLLVLSASGSRAGLFAQTQNADADSQPQGTVRAARTDNMAVHIVRPGRLRVTVVERGTVEAAWIANAFCRVKGGATISWISPDGTMVLAGQPVCQLDSFPLQKQLADQLTIEEQAEAALEIAKHSRLLAVIAYREFTAGNAPRDENALKKLRADVENKQAEESVKRAIWQRERSKSMKLDVQIESCTMFASAGGVLVHANNSLPRVGQSIIDVGATVRERQHIFSIVDPTGPMLVIAHVHEPVIDQINRGLKSRIKVDAFPGESVAGTVSEVAPLPDAVQFFPWFVKTYTTKVQIDQAPAEVRPGMTAQVEILANDLENVLSVPVEAVVRYDQKDHVAVKKPGGGFEWREVTLGLSNEQQVEVKQGIQSGELVAIQPLNLLSEAQKRALRSSPTPPAAAPNRRQ
jgi:RND family efflux transporter MFP subunit